MTTPFKGLGLLIKELKLPSNLQKGGLNIGKQPPKSIKKRPPATTPEARENQLISLAVDLAEKQLLDGTASSQVISHYLKLGSTKERIEKEILEQQKELIIAKTQSIQSSKRVEELYTNALNAMRSYAGSTDVNDDD